VASRSGVVDVSVPNAQGDLARTSVYVYAAEDWPAWQRALRLDATRRFDARSAHVETPVAPSPKATWQAAWEALDQRMGSLVGVLVGLAGPVAHQPTPLMPAGG